MSAINFANNQVEARIKEWTNSPYDQATRDEIAALLAAGKKDELEDRFYKPLEFGTGGLRGKLGAGTNRMNSYVVARATQGLANYVRAHATRPGPLRAAIAHDSRHRSREFAETAAGVFAANGIIVHISPELRPTPYLSYAVRELGCHTGIMVTASHNPKEYNGYKVYWDDGSQVIPPHDEGIITEVNKVTGDDLVKRVSFEEGVAKGLIKVMGDEMDEAFLDAVLLQRFDKEIIRKHQPTIVYTPLHGVGGTMAPRALAMWGFEKVLPEPEQMKPNGDFPPPPPRIPRKAPPSTGPSSSPAASNRNLFLPPTRTPTVSASPCGTPASITSSPATRSPPSSATSSSATARSSPPPAPSSASSPPSSPPRSSRRSPTASAPSAPSSSPASSGSPT